jgi:hypothetical protein
MGEKKQVCQGMEKQLCKYTEGSEGTNLKVHVTNRMGHPQQFSYDIYGGGACRVD